MNNEKEKIISEKDLENVAGGKIPRPIPQPIWPVEYELKTEDANVGGVCGNQQDPGKVGPAE